MPTRSWDMASERFGCWSGKAARLTDDKTSRILDYGVDRSNPNRIQRGLVLISLTLFFVSLCLPAYRETNNTITGNSTYVGLTCLLFGWWWIPSNVLFLYTPRLARWSHRTSRRAQITVTTISTISTAFVVFGPPLWQELSMAHFLIGFYLWAAAHCLSTTALYLHQKRS